MHVQHWPDRAPDKSKPYCVVDSNGTILNWYATREEANNAMRMPMEHSYLVPVRRFSEGWLDDGSSRWIQFYPYSTWDHPVYGQTTITRDNAEEMVRNFNDKIYGEKVTADYEHGLDKAKGSLASGDILQLEARDDGLWGLVKFTDTAKKEIDEGGWNFWSTSHWDRWTNEQTNQSYNYVLDGGALTNKPWVKGMAPLNFSEVAIEETLKEFAVWSTAFINDLPDSAFLYIQSGGSKDSEGKTKPRSLRHFPYKDGSGNIDLPHLRNAIARIPQSGSWLSDSLKTSLQNRARKLLGAKSNAEVMAIEAIAIEDEMAPEEHHEPGTGFIDPNINRDDSADTGSRIDTPPEGEDGSVPNRSDTVTPVNVNDSRGGNNSMTPEEMLAALRASLGLGEDVDLVAHVSGMNTELEPLRELQKQNSELKAFSEAYPDEFARLQKLEEESRDNFAKSFSEKLATRRVTRKEVKGEGDDQTTEDVSTSLGLSGLAIETIKGVAKKFSEGNATFEDFSGALDAIMDNGIVDYGTAGSSNEVEEIVVPTTSADVRKKFAEVIANIQKADSLDFNAAMKLAIEREPDLARAWHENKPVVTTNSAS